MFDAIEDPWLLKDISAKTPNVVDSLNSIYDSFWESLPEKAVLVRHRLGAKDAPEIRLNAMDWYKGNSPHTQWQIASKKNNGVWPVTIENNGRYRFELRSFPREHPQKIPANKATINIGEKSFSQTINTQLEKIIFEIELKKGQYDLSTLFESNSNASKKEAWGANFVYLQQIDNSKN